jgi:hypothetical protein
MKHEIEQGFTANTRSESRNFAAKRKFPKFCTEV